MLKTGCVRFFRTSAAVQTLVLASALFSAHAAFAATDWSEIQAAMGTDGFVTPGDVLRFQLVRKDMSYSVNGTPVNGVFIGAWTNGFVAFKKKNHGDKERHHGDGENHDGEFYADGSLPAQVSELSALQDALLEHPEIHIAATYSHIQNISPQLVWLHFEATGPGAELATWIATALETIHNPQLRVSVIPGTNSVFDPEEILPPEFLALFDEGFFAQVDDFFTFWLPRPDEKKISLDDHVKAQSGLGVGQTFYINIDLSGDAGASAIINVDFAVRDDEVRAVQSILRTGGFTLSSLSNNYVSDSPRLYFLHATASGDGFALGEVLLKVVKVIEKKTARRCDY